MNGFCSNVRFPLSSTTTAGVLFIALTFGLVGCVSSSSIVNQGLSSASEAAGEQIGKAIGAEIARSANLPPAGSAQYNQFMVSQAQVMFSYAFSAGGMWPAQAQFESGEWATYQLRSADGGTALDTLERAFLKTTDEGHEWWRIRGVHDGEAWVYEALLDTTRQEVVRLRTKDPEGKVGEVPVTEKTLYSPPQRLTQESIEGATTETEQVNTPAGTFAARRVEYTGAGQGGTVTWFMSEEVPGHVVRYQASRSGSRYTSDLLGYGSDATTQLESY